VKFYQTVLVEPGGARQLARLTDQTPLLMEQPLGEGRVLVFASTFDNLSNDFPLHAAWVPFIDQTARYLARLEGREVSVPVDTLLELHPARERRTAVEVVDPRGRRALSLTESVTAQSLVVGEEGFYEVHRAGGRKELVAVNADRQESNFELIPAETLKLWQNTSGGAPEAEGRSTRGERRQGLWWHLMAVVLIVGVVESLVGNRHLSVQRETG
jgi:hypothetical protein